MRSPRLTGLRQALSQLSRREAAPGRSGRAALLFPQRLARDLCAFDHRLQFRPHDARMDALREWALRKAAIGAGHYVVASDDVGELHQPLGDEFRMLDNVGGVADHAGDQDLVALEFDRLPHAPFVGVTWVGGLKGISADADL